MNERATEIYAYMHAMKGVLSAMSSDEREELEKWEVENIDGHSIGTSDWPGWVKYIGAKPTFKNDNISREGFVYLIRNGESNKYKIGLSKNVFRRLNSMQTGNPDKLSLICFFPAIDAFKQEQELHNHFSIKRSTGEWFILNDNDVNYFLSVAKNTENGT